MSIEENSFMLKNKEAMSARTSGKNNPMYGKSPSEEWKDYFSQAFSGEGNPFYNHHHSEETKLLLKEMKTDKSKPVDMIDIDTGNVIKTFCSLNEARRYINKVRGYDKADKSFIKRCASGEYPAAYGYAWKFSARCND